MSLQFHGVDFTSAPSRRKPIAVASMLKGEIFSIQLFQTLDDFEAWLSETEGVIGIDAPFGYPLELCEELFPGKHWSDISEELGEIGSTERLAPLAERVAQFRDARPVGKKEPKRRTDMESNSASAMKFFQPPVGRMAARLLPILARTGHNVLPFDPTPARSQLSKSIRRNGYDNTSRVRDTRINEDLKMLGDNF